MLSILKLLAVGYLKRSNDPELQKLAALINDAPKELVEIFLDLITGDLRTDGMLTRKTAERILGAQTRFLNSNATKKPNIVAPSVVPYLEQYLDLFRSIGMIASWRKAIYLQGFLHRPDCSSLWLFNGGVTQKLELGKFGDGPYEITYPESELKIFVFQKMTEEDFLEKNKAIGDNYSVWRMTIVEALMEKVIAVSEDYVKLQRTDITERIVRKGTKREATIREETTSDNSYPFSERTSGVNALIESLPCAIEARDSSLNALRKRLGE